MKKLMLFALLLLHAGFFVAAQTTIVQWNFNSNFSNIPSNGTAPAPSVGAGTLNLIGNVTADNAAGVGADGGTPNNALNTTSYPAQGTNPKTAGIQINLNTTGYNNIHIRFYSRHSGSAANRVVLQHITSSPAIPVYDTFYTTSSTSFGSTPYEFDLSNVNAVNNSSNIVLQLVTDFAAGNAYQGVNTGYGTGGTIRYDLITITGNPIGCTSPATQQATGLRLLKTDATSAQLTLNRGNGGGCLVLCSAAGVPSAVPVTGTTYSANSNYASGAALGNAYAVYNTQTANPATQYFNITGLTASTKYYLAAYEYSATGQCYLTPALVDSFYCNSTVLYPGDVQFVGYDNSIASGGKDAFALVNMKSLKTGTAFQIVNSRYEAGAAANVRTQKWFAGSSDIYGDLATITLLYTGSSALGPGSVISFEFAGSSPANVLINGSASNSFSIKSLNITGTSSMLSNSDPEQFFLTQGKFTAYGTSGIDQYSTLDGHVLHGISYIKSWVDFSQACSSGTTMNDRESRIPPDIKCLNLYFPVGDFAYYKSTSSHTGSQPLLISQIASTSNWTNNAGSSSTNDISSIYSNSFTVAGLGTSGLTWTGTANTNWFNCSNWDNLFVPDSTTDATVPVVTNSPQIDAGNSTAAEYSKVASSRNLTVIGNVGISGAGADKLVVTDSLLINAAGIVSTANSSDSIVVRSYLQTSAATGLQLSTNGWLGLYGNRQLKPIGVLLAGDTATRTQLQVLSLNNPPGINISSGGFESIQKLELLNGILAPSATSFHYLGPNCTINSPTNYFNEINKGWEGSYIDGKVYVRTSSTGAYTAPIGSKQRGIFAPLVFEPESAASRLYIAGYNGMSHPNTAAQYVNTPPIDHVSVQEYWTLMSPNPFAAAKLTLYYTPNSAVGGGGGTMTEQLNALQIAQYWDSSIYSDRKWRLYGTPGTFIAGPNTLYGKISYNRFATSLADADKNFTLATRSVYNTLPVQLLTWKATLQTSRTRLDWALQDEAEVLEYTVEKSLNGKDYYLLQTLAGIGSKSYNCFDNYPATGWNYYRLKISNKDGKQTYSAIEKVWNKTVSTMAVFPNPAKDRVYISVPQSTNGVVTVYAADGRKYLQQTATNTSFVQLNIEALSSGWYVVVYSNGKTQYTKRLFIK